MENQITVQETKTMSLLKHLKSGKEHSLAVAHFEESNLLQSSEEDIKMVLKRVILLLGIKKESFPSEIQKGLILEFLKENYSFLTVSEIRNAFELAIMGKLDVSSISYQSFNCEYICSILNAYKRYIQENKIYTKYLDRNTNKINTEDHAQQIKEANDNFLSKKYSEFQELIKLAIEKVYSGEFLSLDVTDLEVTSFYSALKSKGFILHDIQKDWIHSAIEKVDYSSYMLENDKRTFESIKNNLQNKHKERLTVEITFCKMIKAETGIDPNKFFCFTIGPKK